MTVPAPLDFEGGHGTFIAGVIAQLCPDAEVHTAGVLSSFGDGDVADVIAGLAGRPRRQQDADRHRRDELRGVLRRRRPGDLLGEQPGAAPRRQVRGLAAAGNQVTCRPYFPAGLTNVNRRRRPWPWEAGRGLQLGWVGRRLRPGRRCCEHVLRLPARTSPCSPSLGSSQPRVYQGLGACWSGTSFSAPKVAAVLAQEMYLNLNDAGSDLITAREAWRRLTTHDHLRMPDLGVVFNA